MVLANDCITLFLPANFLFTQQELRAHLKVNAIRFHPLARIENIRSTRSVGDQQENKEITNARAQCVDDHISKDDFVLLP